MSGIKGVPNPATQKVSDDQVHEALKKHGGNRRRASYELGVTETKLYERIKRMRERGDFVPTSISHHKAIFSTQIRDGVVLVGSDPHYWPGEFTTCQRAFLYFVKNYEPRPKAVVLNGDIFDGSRVSRFNAIGFLENRPTVAQELVICDERLTEIEDAAPKGVPLIWPLGNHDLRYESYLAANTPELRGVEGMALKDRFPRWHACWTFWVNEHTQGWLEVKHRYRGGILAVRQNALNSGINIITGHLHNMQVYRWRNRRGRMWSVDAGTLADTDGEQFVHYTEASETGWESGFCVITFKDGLMMKPELVVKWDENHVEFRGQLIEV
jgi:hypothetical protein